MPRLEVWSAVFLLAVARCAMITSGTYEEQTEVAAVTDERVSIRFEEFARNRMTPAQKRQFSRDGYLILHNVLAPDELGRLKSLVEDLREQKLREGWLPDDNIVQSVFSPKNDLQMDPNIIALLLQPKIFPKVVDILGTNIYLYHSYLFDTRAADPGTMPPDDFGAVPTFGFHQDSGVQRDIRNAQDLSHEVMPRMSLKCAYYLTDQSVPGRGNTWVVPGSMEREHVEVPEGGRGKPVPCCEVCNMVSCTTGQASAVRAAGVCVGGRCRFGWVHPVQTCEVDNMMS